MKSLKYYGPGSIRIEDTPPPVPAPGEVLVAVDACGVCATDLKTFVRGHPKIRPGSGLGHEVAGVVVDAPASMRWRRGMRVAVAPYVPCGECGQCRRGRFSLCPSLFTQLLDPGGFSEFIRVPERIAARGMIELPDALPAEAACFAEPVACCLHGLSLVHLGSGDSLLVIGDGVMGLLQAAIGRALGAHPIIVSGMTTDRLAMAGGVADIVVHAGRDDVAATVREATDGEGADVVMVSVADVGAAELALRLVKKGGAINLFAGMPAGAVLPLDMNRVHYDEVLVTGSFGFGPDDFRRAVELIADGTLDVTRFVTTSVSLDDIVAALEKLARMEGLKTVVRCSGTEGRRA